MAERRPAVAERPTDRAEAFLRLADHHLDAAYRLARAILRDSTEAQDATHDAFEQAWRKWSTLRDQSRFEPWFDRILPATLLPDGTVLVVGGVPNAPLLGELYDARTKAWVAAPNSGDARQYGTATLLPNGTVLVAGGRGGSTSAELYDPGLRP